jgi:hypothetical protein
MNIQPGLRNYFWKLDPDPHSSKQVNPYPHSSQNSEAYQAQIRAEDVHSEGREAQTRAPEDL